MNPLRGDCSSSTQPAPLADETTAPPRRRGFTLVELLVAMALMTILTGSVVFIFMQAQNIFSTMDARVQVYQYARYAFDQMERDLANLVVSRDMEFFNDRPLDTLGVKGHYDPGEEIPIRNTANKDGDPINGDSIYNRSFTLRQPAPYEDGRKRKHRRDSLYFKTVTVIEGMTSNALIEYALVDEDKVRPRMIKRLWRVTGVDRSNPLAPRYEINGTDQGLPIEQDLCLYAVDTKFEVFIKNHRRSDSGRYYEAAQLVDPPRSVRVGNPKVFEPLPNAKGWVNPNFMVQAYYNERWNDAMLPDFGVIEPLTDSMPALFHTQANFAFPMLKEGDKIYLADTQSTPAFKAKEYTIKAFIKAGTDPIEPYLPTDPPSLMRIQFEETIDTNGVQVQTRYAAAWVPPAMRVTIRIKDARSRELRTVSRIFKILAN